ncbi:hypothetical protein ACJIZ3_021030 [Penstemon smallii]|uniref:Uncharacterized protein n=1 Tax=Penstemon smallii TaxID=265156 RepID=A0ABD3SKT2_9LAMI
MDPSRKSNKIRDIVRLQQILKKWKNLAHNNKSNAATTTTTTTTGRSIKFLKKSLSFSDISSLSPPPAAVPKGYVAVCVGKELKRFVIPTEYLSHQAFGILLREAEEEFGFQQEGILKFPCEVDLFEKILRMMEDKRFTTEVMFLQEQVGLIHDDLNEFITTCGDNYSPDLSDLTPTHHLHPQMCR